jgi:hypothetical protein
MGTPWLWATIEVALSPTSAVPVPGPKHRDTTIQLLSCALERSVNCPLTIHCYAVDEKAGPGLELLVLHSARWRTLDIYVELPAFHFLSPAKGSLPLLERLDIGGSDLDLLDIFESAPKLTHFGSSELCARPLKLPWVQLQHVRYSSCVQLYTDHNQIGDALTIMRCFSAGCDVQILNLDLTEIDLPVPALPAIESKTWSLELSAMDVQDPAHFRQAFGEILGALTLPLLQHLTLLASGYEPLSWPRHHFLAFASRSSFRHTLTNFSLDNIIISEDELVE